MASKVRVSNPLALPVLALLRQRPMHPYEIATLIRERHWQGSIKFTVGSLYTVVEALRRDGLIEAKETRREGRRPERTVYALTEAGRTELVRRLREMLSQPFREYPRFAAGLTLITVLPRAEVIGLLEERTRLLAAEIDAERADLEQHLAGGLPRLFGLDTEYALVQRQAELDWLRGLLRDIADGTLAWPTRGPRRTEGGSSAPERGSGATPAPPIATEGAG